MAAEWQPTLLGEVIDVKHGFAFQGEFIHDEPRGDILLTPGNFAIGGGFKGDKFKYYEGQVPDDYVLNEGDLIVTMTDLSKQSDTLGYPAIVPSRSDGRRYLHNQRLGKIQLKAPDRIDARFLHYLLCTAEYRHEVLAGATGTTVKHTSPERIKRFRFSRPPLKEQQTIGGILGTFDQKIEVNRRNDETLDETLRAIFKSWLVEFEPVRAKARGETPDAICRRLGLTPDLLALFPDRLVKSSIGDIPDGWEVKPLDKIANYLNGLALQKYPPESDTAWLPVIKIAQLKRGDTKGADRASSNLDPNYIVTDGDVLFSWSGSLDIDVWRGGAGALNQHLFKVTSSVYPKWFFLCWTREHLVHFRRIAAGKAVTMGHIQRKHLTEALCAVPPAMLLDAVGGILAPLLTEQVEHGKQSRTLAALRDALLPKLLSGELRAPLEGAA